MDDDGRECNETEHTTCQNTQRDLLNVYELGEIRFTPSYPLEICIVFRAGVSQEYVNTE